MTEPETTDYLLTTVDNPYSPFTEFKEWLAFDIAAGHHSLALLGRVTTTSDDLSDADQEQAIRFAIDEIVSENVSGLHTKAFRSAPLPT